MQQIVLLLVLIFYLISLACLGRIVIKKWFPGMPVLLTFVGMMLIGTGIGVPVTYLVSCLMAFTGEPILWGVFTTTVMSFGLFGYALVKQKPATRNTKPINFSINEILLIVFSLIFSTWLMTKTFHGGADGQLFVGSNNVFDFGHALGIVRSFSWGNNIPFTSPFQAGLPFFYHFFFYFFVAIWEYFGVPIVWAMNIPSILSFASLLIMVYFLPQILLGQKKLAGWLAVILTITHSTLTFWYLMIQKGFNLTTLRDIWRLPTYSYAGPYDGSVISIFMTLNNYVNQRHLAFGIALGLFLIMCLVKLIDDKRLTYVNSAVLGVFTGCMFLWNSMICASTCVVIILLLVGKRRWKEIVFFTIPIVLEIFIFLMPILPFWRNVWLFESGMLTPVASGAAFQARWNIFQYLWENLGILPFIAAAGFFVIPKLRRFFIVPFILLFGFLCLYSAYGKHGFDQKFLSVLIIGINVLAAVGLGWLWERKRLIIKTFAILLFIILTVSGVVDLIPIKNEFAFPLIGLETVQLISWIKNSTPKDAVFISYSDMIDPVVLAGRKNYFGFFGNIVQPDRSDIVRLMYAGNLADAVKNNISYILVTKWQKSDFPYTVYAKLLTAIHATAYEDTKYLILQVVVK